MSSIDKLIEAKELKGILGNISEPTLNSHEKKGIIPRAIRIGRRKFWRKSVIEAWLDAKQPMPTAQQV